MAWRTPTETDLLDFISGAEMEALRAAVLSDGQADPIATQLSKTVEMVRGYIAANTKNTLGAAGTLPERLIGPCCEIAILKIGSRAAGLIFDTDNVRRDAARAATRILEAVAAGDYAIEQPETAGDAAQQGAANTPSFSEPCRKFANQDGI
jgi:hypothetical protein